MKILSAPMHSSYICSLRLKVFYMSRSCIHWVIWWISRIFFWISKCKSISNLTMTCYHQNTIKRTLRLTLGINIMHSTRFRTREWNNSRFLAHYPLLESSILVYVPPPYKASTSSFPPLLGHLHQPSHPY